jgi:four helix bundle protein
MSQSFILRHRELQAYALAFDTAMQVFDLVQEFPDEEWQLLREQMVKASRSVCANVAEAWQKRRYRNAFVAKLNEAEARAGEMQTWLEFAVMCSYLDPQTGQELVHKYNQVLANLGRMIDHADAWTF